MDIPTAHVEMVLAMESDRMAHLVPALDESKLKIQKGVVKNEYRQNYANRPYGMVWPLLAEALYPPQHPYNWLTIGVMEDLESASLEDVSAFFQRYYVPANASLAVVGDIDLDEMPGAGRALFRLDSRRDQGASPLGSDRRAGREPRIVAPGSRRAGSAVHELATVPHFHDDDARSVLLGRHPGPGQGKPALPEAGDRASDCPGRDAPTSRAASWPAPSASR